MHIAAHARTGDTTQTADRRTAVLGVPERDADDLARVVGVWRLHLEALDVALLLQDARDFLLQLGRRNLDGLMRCLDRVANTRQEVGYGIGHRHVCLPARL